MPTYRSFAKGVVRTMKKVDRQAKQAERRRAAYEKAAQRQDALEVAADAAAEWNTLITQLTGAHRTLPVRIDSCQD